MKTELVLSDVTIQVSSEPVLTMPRSLVRQLGVRKGERVSVLVRNGTLSIRRNGLRKLPIRPRSRTKPRARRVSSFADLAGAIPGKPGAPKINFEEMFSHHGYEQLEGKAWMQEMLKPSSETKGSE